MEKIEMLGHNEESFAKKKVVEKLNNLKPRIGPII